MRFTVIHLFPWQAIWNHISISFSTSRLWSVLFVLALWQYPSLPIARYSFTPESSEVMCVRRAQRPAKKNNKVLLIVTHLITEHAHWSLTSKKPRRANHSATEMQNTSGWQLSVIDFYHFPILSKKPTYSFFAITYMQTWIQFQD